MGYRPPINFCADCGKPISNTAVRCQRCAMRNRVSVAPSPTQGAEDVVLRRWNLVTREEINLIRDAESDLQAALAAQRLNIAPEVVRTIRGSLQNAAYHPTDPDTMGSPDAVWDYSAAVIAERMGR